MSKLPLAPTVLSTKAPKHYGTSCMSAWDPIRDRGFAKVKDPYDDTEKCEIMQWFIYMVCCLISPITYSHQALLDISINSRECWVPNKL
jgi:hypothetical protein